MTICSWIGPGGFSSSAQNTSRSSATLAMVGTYTLTVTNTNGCSDDESTSVTVNTVTYNVGGTSRQHSNAVRDPGSRLCVKEGLPGNVFGTPEGEITHQRVLLHSIADIPVLMRVSVVLRSG